MDALSTPIPSGHAASRRIRSPIPGPAHLITATTAGRRPWLRLWPIAVAVAREVGGSRPWRGHHVHAWVMMPDRFQVLLTPAGAEPLSRALDRAKDASARAARMLTGSRAPFWAGAFRNHALRRGDATSVIARRLIGNPVRAGLVDSIWEWPFWDCERLPPPGADGIGRPLPASSARSRPCAAVADALS